MDTSKPSISGINVHLYPSDFLYESRIEKIAVALEGSKLFQSIWLIGVADKNLPNHEARENNIRLFRVGIPTMRSSFALKLWAFLRYYAGVIAILRGESVACINAHSLSVLPLVVFLKYMKNCKVIYDTHELETETYSLEGLRQRLAKIVESTFVKKADAIFCVSNNISDWYQKIYNIDRPTTILNSPHSSPAIKSNFIREKLNISEDIKILLYLGVIEPGRGIELMLNSFLERKDLSTVIVFVGYGSLIEKIQKSPAYGRTVYFYPAVAKEEIPLVAASADFGVCLVSPSCLSYEYCMPNKLFEYLTSGLPVIASPCSSLQDFITHHKVGFVISEMTSMKVNQLIDSLNKIDLAEIKIRAREVAQKNCWEVQSQMLVQKYNDLFQNRVTNK